MSWPLPVAVFIVALLGLIPALGQQDVWSKDEARPGLVAREMVETGRWWIPHLGGRAYPDKPPLYFWAVALLSPGGVTAWSLRLPSAIAAAATVAATYAIGARIGGRAVGLASAALLASSATFVHWARTGRMESLLVLWIALGFWSLVRWRASGRRRDAALMGLWIGLGWLTKGPLAVLPVVVAVALLGFGRETRWKPWIDLALAPLIAAGVVLAWLLSAWHLEPDFPAYLAAVAAGFADEVRTRPRRYFGYPLEVIAAGFLPWTLLLLAAGVTVAQRWRKDGRALAVPVAWAMLTFIGVITAITPREVYFLPIYPALALITGWAWCAAASESRWIRVAMTSTVAVVALIGAVIVLIPLRPEVHNMPIGIPRALGAVVMGVALVTVVVPWALRGRGTPTAIIVVAAAGALLSVVLIETTVYAPAANSAYPTRPAAARFAAALPPDADVLFVDRQFVTALVFYLPERATALPSAEAARDLVGRPKAHALVVDYDLRLMRERLCLPVRALHRETVYGAGYTLIDFKGAPPPGCDGAARGRSADRSPDASRERALSGGEDSVRRD